jgi:penicillin amidase
VPGVNNDVICYYDEWGIPHIFAQTDADMFFTIGYVQARDRLFQLDMMRRMYTGRLAEILGEDYLESDIYFRNICLERAANATWHIALNDPSLSSHLASLESYSDGINYFIDHMSTHEIPPEFRLINYIPDHWQPHHTLAFGKFMSYALAFQEYDFTLAILADHFTEAELLELVPINNTIGMIPVLPNYGSYPSPPEPPNSTTIINSPHVKTEKIPSDVISKVHSLLTAKEKVKNINFNGINEEEYLKSFSSILGSNNWVIDGDISSTGYPILCNDMHLPLTQPSIWYEMQHASAESGINVYGFSFIGSSGVIAGHTSYAAWGFTNVGADVTDYYYYNTRVVDGKEQYLNGSLWQDFEVISEIIPVKGQEDYEFEIKFTGHGPVLSYDTGLSHTSIAVRWTGHDDLMYGDPDYILKSVQGYWMSTSLSGFIAAQREWDIPGQNFVIATTDGHIAMRPCAHYPIRPQGNWGRIPVNGSDPSNDWLGYIPYNDLPVCHDPAQHFLTSTNQKTTGPNYPYFLGSFFDDGYRSRRITSLIQSKSSISVEDLQKFQSDNVDTRAHAFRIVWESVATPNNSTLQNALDYLNEWGNNPEYEFGEMDRSLVAPTIFSVFLDFFIENTFEDEYMGAEVIRYPQWHTLENMTLYNQSVKWFDDISTSSTIESIEDIAHRALVDTVDYLASKEGLGTSNMSEWLWGRYHTLNINHLADLGSFNSGPYPWDGSGYTLNAAGGRRVTSGPSERVVYSLNPLISSLPHAWSSLPGGENGNPLSNHYRDQLEALYINRTDEKYGYHLAHFYQTATAFKTAADVSSIDDFYIESTLILRPGG